MKAMRGREREAPDETMNESRAQFYGSEQLRNRDQSDLLSALCSLVSITEEECESGR